MKQLELKHIAPYLPYGVKFISELDKPYDELGKQPIWTLNGVHELFSEYSLLTKENKDSYDMAKCKLILRPLSQLIQEIEHNGKKFVPIVDLEKIRIGIDIYRPINLDYPIEINIETENYSQTIDLYDGYLVMQKLFEWNFDVFGLIDNGLALNMNEV